MDGSSDLAPPVLETALLEWGWQTALMENGFALFHCRSSGNRFAGLSRFAAIKLANTAHSRRHAKPPLNPTIDGVVAREPTR